MKTTWIPSFSVICGDRFKEWILYSGFEDPSDYSNGTNKEKDGLGGKRTFSSSRSTPLVTSERFW